MNPAFEASAATPALLRRLALVPTRTLVTLMFGVAALAAIIAATFLWSRTPDYRVLFANVADRDGAAIVAALAQMNVAYRYTEGGGAILVPAERVHDTRLKLASQGLPKGGTVGFELMDNQKMGTTQFQEQVNYQRGLEGELAKSIMSLAAVQGARVHLAMPRPSVFMRESEKPSASVLVQLHPGRGLERPQVAGIVHLVSASVPELPVKNVSVVDQNGTLLSAGGPGEGTAAGRLDANQLAYVREIENSTIKRIEDILAPVLGSGNVRAQVTADVDFSLTESTAETWKPNQDPPVAAVRSSQTRENGVAAQRIAGGVPGAASNQPGAEPRASVAGPNSGGSRDSTVNYELDKTVKVTRAPVGTVKRLSAAVVVNHRKLVGDKGKVTMAPLAKEEVEQINALVKEAMGFQPARNDSLNVVNAAFSAPEREPVVETPLWKQPGTIAMARDTGSGLVLGLLALLVFFGVLRPAMRALASPPAMASAPALSAADEPQRLPAPQRQERAAGVKALAAQDPKIVANVVKSWVQGSE